MVYPKPLERLVNRLRDVLGVAADQAARDTRSHAELRGEEDVVPLARPLEPCNRILGLQVYTFPGIHTLNVGYLLENL